MISPTLFFGYINAGYWLDYKSNSTLIWLSMTYRCQLGLTKQTSHNADQKDINLVSAKKAWKLSII
jgi:hypothetical protein